jgi:hypothetical protein
MIPPLGFVLDEHLRGPLWEPIPDVLEYLTLAAHAVEPEEWRDRIVYFSAVGSDG